MLDELSRYSAPSNDIIINELNAFFLKDNKFKNLEKNIISIEINKFINNYPREKLGSLSGYYMFVKDKIIIELNKILESFLKDKIII